MNNYVLIIVLIMFGYTAERMKVHLNNSYFRVKSLRTEQFFLHSHAFTLPKCQSKYSQLLIHLCKGSLALFFSYSQPFLLVIHAIYSVSAFWTCASKLLPVDFEEFFYFQAVLPTHLCHLHLG